MVERGGRPRLLHEPPAARLVRQAIDREHLDRHLATLEWESGTTSGRCAPGALLATVRNGRRVSVCPGFAKIVASQPSFGATLVIHEQLHALGLGENPPTSTYITTRVYHWCR